MNTVTTHSPGLLQIELQERLHYRHPESRQMETISLANCIHIVPGSLEEESDPIAALKARIEDHYAAYGATEMHWENEE